MALKLQSTVSVVLTPDICGCNKHCSYDDSNIDCRHQMKHWPLYVPEHETSHSNYRLCCSLGLQASINCFLQCLMFVIITTMFVKDILFVLLPIFPY